ncbi:beta-ketoacyl synthase [Candidatus Koribacter versatilis Ellin345]|uniref:Beta-ketoacyl synthase n=1 Tax=Koribacter versatilis (strain Ellin345) TaxID=204669 RepID=Q1IP29_KORVE|nr:beta-ketoacyl-[acyl-carrier-protein] synthase family protein [Candidatus Koribacter versatilis]ABF41371.1 beta-ketoacyl synthase [Candidatus Koribacter versatilis Ellin345]
MDKRVVITGMGVVSPNGIGRDAFCRAILDGKSGVKKISRFDASKLPVRIAGEITDFDESQWIDPHERKHVGRAVPLAFAASAEALQQAGLDPEAMSLDDKRKIGVVLGTGGGAQDYSEEQYRLYFEGKIKQVSLFSIPSGTMGTMSSEISMRFGFRGMSHVVTCGCTSSTDAIAYAAMQIRTGQVPMMLTGGVDSPLAPGIMKGFCLMKIMTQSWNDDPERASRPFSADRDGFVLAEGAWMFILEDYDHARARGATPLAEIAGYASTCEAFHRVRLQECGEEPARTIVLAMENAGIAPEQVDYANLHGTSTQLNDRIETRALKLALGDHAAKIPMSSLKSQIGHPQGASGAAGIAATLVAMRHGEIPPTINIERADPDCDLDYTPHAGRKHGVEYAVCNCIAFGSKNSALVLRNLE